MFRTYLDVLTISHIVGFSFKGFSWWNTLLLRFPRIFRNFLHNVLIEVFCFLFRCGVVFNTLNRFIFNKITDLELTVRKI